MTRKKDFYLSVLNQLKIKTNLSKIQEKLSISKQDLNYYIRVLKKNGLIIQKGRGWYEVKDKVKNSTKYDIFLDKDISRGHACVWEVKISKEIPNYKNRINILKEKGINFNLVGALKTTPRIKVLGRKIWLCNDHIRIYDKKDNSYYGKNATESRYYALQEVLLIVGIINSKFGLSLKEIDITFKKEHYALIKNDLAIENNKRGEIIRVSDEFGEWLLIDDSLEQGGELETIGKKAYPTNIKVQKWWNDMKKTNFEVTPTFLMESIGGMIQVQQMNSDNIVKHQKVLDEMLITLKKIQKSLEK